MRNTVGRAAGIAAAALASSGAADAATTINLPLSAILTNGSSYSGSFDISSFLSDAQGNQYEVTGGNLSVSGTSNFGTNAYAFSYSYVVAYTTYAVVGYSSYSCGWFRTCSEPVYGPVPAYAYVPVYAPIDSTVDRLVLAAGGVSNTAYTSGNGYPTSYYGSLVTSLNLSDLLIDQANASGLLGFTASGYSNTDVRLTGATLSLDLAQLPPVELPPVEAPVPEAATWMMMTLGFGAVGAAMRTRRRRVAVA